MHLCHIMVYAFHLYACIIVEHSGHPCLPTVATSKYISMNQQNKLTKKCMLMFKLTIE
jgi:hypothetical protein